MPQVSTNFNKDDGLEVRSLAGGFAVFDRATKTYVSTKQASLYWCKLALEERRKEFRPIIVRSLYGLKVEDSKARGITEGPYATPVEA